ncbi:unnamed protein product, partial [Coregonus sp. 'balchen']
MVTFLMILREQNKDIFSQLQNINRALEQTNDPPPEESGLHIMAEHLSQSELDYPFKLLEYFNGFRVSKVIFSACELGVFDLLLLSQKPLSAERVAQELGASVDGIERLLDVLVGVNILE